MSGTARAGDSRVVIGSDGVELLDMTCCPPARALKVVIMRLKSEGAGEYLDGIGVFGPVCVPPDPLERSPQALGH